jgi:hypothetical protein
LTGDYGNGWDLSLNSYDLFISASLFGVLGNASMAERGLASDEAAKDLLIKF